LRHLVAFLALVLAAAAACTAIAPVTQAAAPPAVPSFERQVLAPYVEVRRGGAVGSGVVIRWRGKLRVLTCSHVAGDAKTVTLRQEDDQGKVTIWSARVKRRSKLDEPGNDPVDLALLEPKAPLGLLPCRLSPGSLRLVAGEPCWYVGTPKGMHRSLERSIVNRPLMRLWGGKRVVVNGNGTYGSSGGPMFVRRGKQYVLAGIVSCFQRTNDARAPMGCESAETIRRFLAGK
jgi:hypothetical protein